MRGATFRVVLVLVEHTVSTHAPHARSDTRLCGIKILFNKFQLTLLMRGATQSLLLHYTCCNVSTHAPHARSDTSSSLLGASVPSFNSRSSCEERPPCGFSYLDIMKFQLTLLMRGATIKPPMQAQSRTFQLTLLMRGATPCPGLAPFIFGFNSRSSCEERRAECSQGPCA